MLKSRALDFEDFPSGTVTEFTTLVCLACIFDIFTRQLGLAPRTAFSEIKRHTPTVEELTSRNAMRPYFDSAEKHPHCPYCGSGKRWHARFDTYCIEGRKSTDLPRRTLVKKLPQAAEQFLFVDKKSDSRAVFFEWLDTLRVNLDLDDQSWLLDATRNYLERRDPKTSWESIFAEVRVVRRSMRLKEGWQRDGGRLFLEPNTYAEAVLIQYLVSRSHAHGGMTLEGRLTLMELIRRLRYFGYLDALGISARDPGEVFEKIIDHLAATQDWSEVRTPLTQDSDRAKGVSTGSGSDRVKPSKKGAKKSSRKSSKLASKKIGPPPTDEIASEAVKLHYIIDRRDFLEKVKSVYASYA
jgi:hypothetical protein